MKGIRYILFFTTLCAALTLHGQAFNIWEGTGCRSKVRLTPYPVSEAPHGNGSAPDTGSTGSGQGVPAVIVCPGGSYFWLDKETEGDGVAKWLNTQGIAAFVLEYRVGTVPGFIFHDRLVKRGNRFPDMLQDVQRSIQLVRENADKYGIDPDKVGVMGFSAGGHLTLMAGTMFDTDVLSQVGVKPSVSLKPDFIAPIYPVVSLVDESVHKRSRRGLLGEGKAISPEMKDSLSMEHRARPDMPPTFLMNCVDDPIVKYHNSELMDSALTANHVPHVYIQYKTGGHGFGANPDKTTAEAIKWRGRFIAWLRNLPFMK